MFMMNWFDLGILPIKLLLLLSIQASYIHRSFSQVNNTFLEARDARDPHIIARVAPTKTLIPNSKCLVHHPN